jgi:ammonium transporter, Amt family
VVTFAVALVVMSVVNAMGALRVTKEGERYGLDLHEHGIPAYPEYVVTAAAQPMGLVQQTEFAPIGERASAKAH